MICDMANKREWVKEKNLCWRVPVCGFLSTNSPKEITTTDSFQMSWFLSKFSLQVPYGENEE